MLLNVVEASLETAFIVAPPIHITAIPVVHGLRGLDFRACLLVLQYDVVCSFEITVSSTFEHAFGRQLLFVFRLGRREAA